MTHREDCAGESLEMACVGCSAAYTFWAESRIKELEETIQKLKTRRGLEAERFMRGNADPAVFDFHSDILRLRKPSLFRRLWSKIRSVAKKEALP